MLVQDFYRIEETSVGDEEFCMTIQFNACHAIFQAHFPGNPITPGVLLLQIGTELLEHRINKKLRLKEAVNIKFKKPVIPSMKPKFVYRVTKEDGNQLLTNVKIEIEDDLYTKMTLRYEII